MAAGDLAQRERRPDEAEARWRDALTEAERSSPEDARVAQTLERLARFYEAQGRHAEAEQAFRRTLKIREQLFGLRGPLVARTLTDLGHLYLGLGRYDDAVSALERALPVAEKSFGVRHRNVAVIVSLLADTHRQQERNAEAERLYQRLVADKQFENETLSKLASLYEAQGRNSEAEPIRQRLRESAERAGTPREAATTIDQLQVVSVTIPEVRRQLGAFTDFEMRVAVRYTLHSVDEAQPQLSAVRFPATATGCTGDASLTDGGVFLRLSRGEGSREVQIPWRSGAAGSPSRFDGGYVTVQAGLWADEAGRPRRLIRVWQFRSFCHSLRAPESR